MLIIGHRGCNYPNINQNTIRAYQEVVSQGATAFEIDVQLTADDALVVVHNLDLSKVSTGTGLVRDKTLAEIRDLYAGDPRKGKDAVPMLSEVLDFCCTQAKAVRPVLHLELKGDGTGIPAGTMIKAYIDLGKLDQKDLLISSFNWQELTNIRTILPDIRIALLDGSIRRKQLLQKLPGREQLFSRIFNYGEEDYMIPWSTDLDACKALYRKEIDDDGTYSVIVDEVENVISGGCYTEGLLDTAVAMGAYSVNLWYDTLVLHSDFVHRVHARGLKLLVYTVNRSEDMVRLVDMGVDGFFTDDYLLAKKVVFG